MTTVVWFKRDLRLQDHGPLDYAVTQGKPVIPLYVIEPDYWQQPDTPRRQWLFIADSLLELDRDTKTIGWCQEQGIAFREWQQFGVVRRLKDRDLWDATWNRVIKTHLLPAPEHVPAPEGLTDCPGFQSGSEHLSAPIFFDARLCPARQTGGSEAGAKLMSSFLERRCVAYQYNISSPNTAPRACSRLSPHIAYGALSLREVYQQAKAAGQHHSGLARLKTKANLQPMPTSYHCSMSELLTLYQLQGL